MTMNSSFPESSLFQRGPAAFVILLEILLLSGCSISQQISSRDPELQPYVAVWRGTTTENLDEEDLYIEDVPLDDIDDVIERIHLREAPLRLVDFTAYPDTNNEKILISGILRPSFDAMEKNQESIRVHNTCTRLRQSSVRVGPTINLAK